VELVREGARKLAARHGSLGEEKKMSGRERLRQISAFSFFLFPFTFSA